MKTKEMIKTTTLLLGVMLYLSTSLFAQKITEVRPVEEFSAIDAGSIFKIEYTQGEDYFLEIEAEERFLENVETSVKNGVLKLEFKGSARNVTIDARIISPELERILLSSSATIRSTNEIQSSSLLVALSGSTTAHLQVNTPSLESRISGASNLTIRGLAEHHDATVSGASQLRASELSTQTTIVKTSGASNARVNAEEYLDANASGTSKISFSQEPASIQIKTSGMASVNGTQAHFINESADGDTTRIRIGGRDLLIIDDEGTDRVRVERRRTRAFRNNWSGFELGINGYLSPDNSFTLQQEAQPIDLRYEKSVIVNINFLQQSFPIISNNLGIYSGLGLSFNNYRFDNQTRIVHTSDGVEFFEDEDPMRKNKLTLTYLTVPVMMELQTSARRSSEKFHIAGGLIIGTRIGTHAKYVYDDGGKKRKEKDYSNFHVPPFRFDLSGRIGWGRVNLFATYALNDLFKDDKGPELTPFSVGIRLVNW
ncbi:MAG: hypothetical protein EA393_03130 [Bacteroidetes bacterium]|nr:MAG: hypothetical protein EA393_03130 [Bacteroidota bacterium]